MSPTPDHHDRRWLVLAVIGIAQLLVVLDVTIVNIALPSAQADLGFSDDDRQWVVTAYALAFGSLLLLGGRIGDLFGRKWTFVGGLLGFAGASAAGGAAESFGVLVAARALQGLFGAMLAPAALSILATTFTDPVERGKAFGVYGAIAGTGGVIGLLLGGALTEALDWRWCLYVSMAFALPAALAGVRLVAHQPVTTRPPIDAAGAVLASAGLFALVFGLSRVESEGWDAPMTLACLAGSALLLAGFVAVQARVRHPLLPLRVVSDRDRAGSFLAIAIVSAGAFGLLLFLTFYLQSTKGMGPLETGVAFIPMSVVVMITAGIVSTRVLARTGARPLVPLGMAIGSLGMMLLTRLEVDSAYASHVLPSLLLVGVGFGLVAAPAFATGTAGVPAHDSGVTSAMISTSQQVGGAVGTALLSTMAVAAAGDALAGGAGSAAAAVEGYVTAFWWSAGVFALGAVVCGALLRRGVHPDIAHGMPEPALAGGAA